MSVWNLSHDALSERLPFRSRSFGEILADTTVGTFLRRDSFGQYVGVTTRLRTVLGALAIVSACRTQPTPTKAHVQMPSLPFELPRLLHGASVRQFSCQLTCCRAPRLVERPVPAPMRAQAAPCPGNVSAEIQKAGPSGIFARHIRRRCFRGEMLLAGTTG